MISDIQQPENAMHFRAVVRAGISRASLWKVESGNPAVAIGIYAAVLHALGNMDKDFLLVAKDDERGRQMQDLGLLTKKRASRRKE